MKLTMSSKTLKRGTILLFSFFYSSILFAQKGLKELNAELSTEKVEAFKTIDIIMTIVLMAGVVYIAVTLIGKKEQSKAVIVGWLLALIVWGIASALLK